MDPTAEQSLHASIQMLAQQLTDVRSDLREVRAEISAVRRPNTMVMITLGGVIIAAGGGLWGLAISPLKEQIQTFATKEVIEYKFAETNKERVRIEEEITAIRAAMATKEQLQQLQYEVQKALAKK